MKKLLATLLLLMLLAPCRALGEGEQVWTLLTEDGQRLTG